MPCILPYFLSQDELERFFSEIRGLGGGFCLHPSPLQFKQRLGQSVKLVLLADESFNLLSKRDQFNFCDPQNNVKFDQFVREVPENVYSDIQIKGICKDLANEVTSKFPDLKNLNWLGISLDDRLMKMYHFFDQSHPALSLRKENNLIKGQYCMNQSVTFSFS